jgi:hypothetical protein
MLTPTVAACALAAALLAAPASAVPKCPLGKYCTDDTGEYTLTVPPLTGKPPPFGTYAECVWQVHVTFGDGTFADYEFDGQVGLSGSHTFPHYGEFTVTAALSEGEQPSHAECPSVTQYAFVLYRSPAEIASAEALEKQEKEAKELKEKEAKDEKEKEEKEPVKSPGGTGGSRESGDGTPEEREKGPSHPILLWRNCSHNVYSHRVACKKAQKVIEGAQEKLSHRKSAKVAGFRCHLTNDLRPISCRRGKGRVLGPLG